MKRGIVLLLCLFLVGCAGSEVVVEKNEDIVEEKISGDNHMAGTIVVFETSKGNFEVELNEKDAPLSSENFLSYVTEGFYDGLIFHRVMDGFMIQGGGFDADMNQKPTKDPIKNEAANGLKNDKYTLAMARTQVIDSATSQFFINVVDNTFLNYRDSSPQGFGYAVFGKVVSGTEVIDEIKGVAVGNKAGHQNVPLEPVTITKAYVKT